MSEFIAPSGVKVVINPAPWKDAKALKKAIQREIAQSGVSLNLGTDITALLPVILLVDSSSAVEGALSACLARCTRDGEKIIEATFDDVNARMDYYDIVIACAKENLGPLAESLASKLPFLELPKEDEAQA